MSSNTFGVRRAMSPPPVYDAHGTPNTTLRPYLTLPYLLSLTWLAYPILSLLFVGFRLQISSASAQDSVADAKGNLLTSCKAAEEAATAAASLPRYLAVSSNEQVADSVNGTMKAARATLILALTILEAVIKFVIDIYRSTFLCFLELVVRGGIAVLIGAVNEISNFIENALGGIRTTIQNEVSTINSAIKAAIDGINAINPFSDITAPQFDVPDLSSLQNVQLPTDFQDALTRLNASLPTVDQLKDAIQDVVAVPFDELKSEINETFSSLNFDSNTLPVPQQNRLSFCGDLDTSVVDSLGQDLLKAAKIGTILIFVIVFLLLLGNCLLEWYKWRVLKQHLDYIRQAWSTDPTLHGRNPLPQDGVPTLTMTDHNLLMLHNNSSHPLITRILNVLSLKLRLSKSKHINLQWFFSYIFHAPALACFLIGFFGILSVQLQLAAVAPLEAKYSQQVNQTVADFSNTIARSVNESMYNQSAEYAADVNGRVDNIQTSINEGVFGWVNGTTTTLNTTINNFYSDVQNAVSLVFNGTILEQPMQDFLRCILGTKVEAIETALTFLHDNLVINMPRVNDTVLVLSQANVDEATRPISLAAVGGGENNEGGLVGRLVARYVDALKKERLMFAAFLLLWLFVVFIASCVLAYHSYIKPARAAYTRRKHGVNGLAISNPYPAGQTSLRSDAKSSSGSDQPSGGARIWTFAPSMPMWAQRFFSRNQRPEISEPRPYVGRSWDSFIDNTEKNKETAVPQTTTYANASPSSSSNPKRSTTNKLTAIGRKAMGRERFVSDEERAEMKAAEAQEAAARTYDEERPGWLKRLTLALRVQNRNDGSAAAVEPYPGTTTANSIPEFTSADGLPQKRDINDKPKLTIQTNIKYSQMPRDQLPTASLQAAIPTSPRNAEPNSSSPDRRGPGPVSAWSPSPTASHVAPYLPPTLLLQSAAKPASPALKQKPRRMVSVPGIVDSTYGPSTVDLASTLGASMMDSPRTQFRFQLQSQLPRAPRASVTPARYPRAHDSLLPDNPLSPESATARSAARPWEHRRSRSSFGYVGGKAGAPNADPFKTPFDDDAAVDGSKPMNPFASPVAM